MSTKDGKHEPNLIYFGAGFWPTYVSSRPSYIASIGNRVVLPNGEVGHIEEIAEDGLSMVRLLTPKNEPSILSTWTETDRLRDGTNIRPRPRSAKWHRESREFVRMVEGTMKQEGLLEAPEITHEREDERS